jgi:tetratricopeptide (TPR) repeat protein
MNRNWKCGGAALACALLLGATGVAARAAQDSSQPQTQGAGGAAAAPAYTLAEYNAYQAAAADKDATQRVKDLDDFVSKFPNSALMPYVYNSYVHAYNELKDYPHVIEYADREVALGPDKVNAASRFQALYLRTLAFNYSFSEKDPTAQDEATQELAAAKAGLTVMDQVPKPANQTDDQWATNKKAPTALFNYTAGIASAALKDYASAVTSFQAALAATPNDAVTYFHLGVAYLQMTPPQSLDGFWALARSVALKGQGQDQVKAYLRAQIQNYQQTGCDNLVDDQITELITLAGTTADRPATYTIPSAADLTTARNDTSNFIPWLKEGGDHGKLMWLATCGLEFPDVAVEVMTVTPADGDNSTLLVYRPAASDPDAAQKEMDAATDPNMTVNIVGQPEVRRLQKGDGVRFTGTLSGYTPTPFMLTWSTAKVNSEDIPPEKAAPGAKRPSHRPAAAAPPSR